jgi:hypothetical protein
VLTIFEAYCSKPHVSLDKWLFLFTRYFALVVGMQVFMPPIMVDVVKAHVATRCMQLIMRQISANYPHAGHLCKPWFATQATAVQIVSCAVDGILMIRGLSAYPHLNLSLLNAIM